MKSWLKASNALCLFGVGSVTVALWQVGTGWALGWLGGVSISFGAFLSRKGL